MSVMRSNMLKGFLFRDNDPDAKFYISLNRNCRKKSYWMASLAELLYFDKSRDQ